jgi:outer membrane immunogenic protein
MKPIAIGIAAIAALLGAPALAADMAVKAPPPPPPPPAYSWTGFYVGGNAGYAWADGQTDPLTGTQSVPGGIGILTWQQNGAYPLTSNLGQRGAIGGLQAGYNWQFNSLVTGIEADFDLSSMKGTETTSLSNVVGANTFSSTSSISRSQNDFGTLRARVGFASDRALFYATGGLAYGESKLGYFATLAVFTNGVNGFSGAGFNSTTTWQAGWTLGGGIEYAPWDRWSVKLEYLYYDLGTQSTTLVASGVPGGQSWTATATARNNGQLVRVGLNYKF